MEYKNREYVKSTVPMRYFYSYDAELESKEYKLTQQYIREERRRLAEVYFVKEDHSLFIKYNAPVFIITESSAHFHTTNKVASSKPVRLSEHTLFGESDWPTLKLYEFDKIVPAEQAYMSIESYLRGVLAREYKSEPKEGDDLKIERAGFDLKQSFRGT
jgi:hypothetical protein